VAVVVGLIVFVAHPWRSSAPPPPPSPPADAVKLQVVDDGVLVGSSAAATTIDVFNQPLCNSCGQFNRSYGGDIQTAMDDKKLAVRFHLLNFLDPKSNSKNYSTRAVASTYCVAAQNDPDLYVKFYTSLFAADFQPPEDGSIDRTDAELAHLAQTVGADSTVIGCIRSKDDVGTAETKAANGDTYMHALNIHGTPAVWDGKKLVDIGDTNWLTNLLGAT
jgi:serine/threonine protein kinase, bacterial